MKRRTGPITGRGTEPAPSGLNRLPRGWLIAAAVVPLILAMVFTVVVATRAGLLHSGVELGDPAPPVELADLSGQPVSLSEYRGRPVIVYFWGSWCPSCIDEFPMLEGALAEHRDAGLAVVGIVVRDRSEAALGLIRQLGASWPSAMDPGAAVAAAFGIYGAPETFFVDPAGIVRARQIGPFSEADLQEHLATILPAD